LLESEALLDEYTESLMIDKYSLDVGLIEQARVYNSVGIGYVNAMSVRDFARAELDRAKAEADRTIRNQAIDENIRITEAQVSNKILEDPLYQDANREYLDWKALTEKWLVLKESFGQRAYALRDLCQLWMSNYYADTAIQSDTAEARDRLATSARIQEAEQRRRRRENS
jgi:hypothetical protein